MVSHHTLLNKNRWAELPNVLGSIFHQGPQDQNLSKLQYVSRSRHHKVCPIENNTNLDSIFYLVKVQKLLLFFYLHLTWLLAHDITKEFWKNSHFENMRAVFLLSCQNSLRWEKSLICHWNIDSWRQKLSFGCVMVPKIIKISSRYNTDYIKWE